MVTGPGAVVGDEIAANPGTQAVGFIGSIATGRDGGLARRGQGPAAGDGWQRPLVVLEDADVGAAVEATLAACFLNAGQSCTAGERILVHEDGARGVRRDSWRPRSHERIRLGDPFDDATTMGPVNNAPTADKTERHVRDAVDRGAKVLTGGDRAPKHGSDLFFSATVLDGVTTRWRSRARRPSARWRRSPRSAANRRRSTS